MLEMIIPALLFRERRSTTETSTQKPKPCWGCNFGVAAHMHNNQEMFNLCFVCLRIAKNRQEQRLIAIIEKTDAANN